LRTFRSLIASEAEEVSVRFRSNVVEEPYANTNIPAGAIARAVECISARRSLN
jgi:non-canonical (house-cleaning) NTP pyrophosphatase